MASGLYTELRKEMRRQHVQSGDLARWTNLSDNSISARMQGKLPWGQREMYAILGEMHIPNSKMYIVFPPDGVWVGSLEDPPLTNEQMLVATIKKMINEQMTIDKIAAQTKGARK